jgi:methionyl-tRNA formyltransferase
MTAQPIRVVFFGDVNSPFGVPHFFEILDTAGCEVVGMVLAPPRSGDLEAMPGPDRWGNAVERSLVEAARARSIPVSRPAGLRDSRAIPAINDRAPDLIVSAGFRSIIPGPVIECARMAAVNFHPSLLPRMRGSNPWFWTLVRGERVTAATVHHMVSKVDAGDIIFQSRIAVGEEDTASTLLRKTILESLRLVHPLVDGLQRGTLPRDPQSEAEATTFREPTDADCRIDWHASATDIHRLIRASTSSPGALTTCRGASLRIARAEIGTDPTVSSEGAAPGDVLKVTPAAVVVKAGAGHLVLRTLRYEGQENPAALVLGLLNGGSSGWRFE